MPEPLDITDTARWVALYRANETDRADSLFKDPLARKLAGDAGEALLNRLPWARRLGWVVVVRTALLDEMILAEVAKGIDCVVNLGAGLDTRPYRLDLPPTLRWVEVDHAPLLEQKRELLKGETPRCELVQHACDLKDIKARRALFATLTGGASRVLVVTEGLLVYLKTTEVEMLARDIREIPCVKGWAFDHLAPSMVRLLQRAWSDGPGGEMKFGVEDLKDFFLSIGWRVGERHSLLHEASRMKREPFIGAFVRGMGGLGGSGLREKVRQLSGCALLRPA